MKRVILSISLAAILISISFQALADYNTWTYLGPSANAGKIFSIAVIPGYSSYSTIFVSDNKNGVYKKTPKSQNFSLVSSGFSNVSTMAVAVSPVYSKDGTVFAGTYAASGGIYKSTDGGANWNAVYTDNSKILSIAVSPNFAHDGIVFAAIEGYGIIKFSDGGGSFNNPLSDATVTGSIAISPEFATDNTAFVGTTGSGVYRTTDGGRTWTQIFLPFPDANISALAISPNFEIDGTVFSGTDHGVFKSTDGGSTWALSNNGIEPADSVITALALSPDFTFDQTLYAGTALGGLCKSINGGDYWTSINNVLGGGWYVVAPESITSFAVSPKYSSDHSLFAGTYSYISSGLYQYIYDNADKTAPVSKITQPSNNSYVKWDNTDTIKIIGSATDSGSGVKQVMVGISSNGGDIIWYSATGTNPWEYTWNSPRDGQYTIYSRAVDVAGNIEAPKAGVTVNVENIPPSISINDINSVSFNNYNYINESMIPNDIQGSVDSSATRVAISFNGGTKWATTKIDTNHTWSYKWKPSDGLYNIVARATNKAGKTNDTSAIAVRVDKTAPISKITPLNNGPFINSSSYTISGTATDGKGSVVSGVQTVEVSSDGGKNWDVVTDASGNGSWAKWNYIWTPPADGKYTIQAMAKDNAANWETHKANITVTVDTTAPTSKITDPTGGDIKGPKYTIKGISDDGTNGSGVKKVEVSYDGGSPNPAKGTTKWSYVLDLSMLRDGPCTITSRATDKAGNIETPGLGVTVNVDSPPTSAIKELNNKPYNSDNKYVQPVNGTYITIAGDDDDGIGTVQKVEVGINGKWYPAELSGTDWTYYWITPKDGKYKIQSRATDDKGYVEKPKAATVVMVDGTAPVSTITTPANNSNINGTSINVTGTAKDAVSGVKSVEVSVDGGASWQQVTSGTTSWKYTWPSPTDGVHYIQSRATDNAGNVENPKSPGTKVTVDNTPPSVSITDPPLPMNSYSLKGTSFTVKGTASDSGTGVAKVEISTDGKKTWTSATNTGGTNAWSTWSYPWLLPDDGQYTIDARATDRAGNYSNYTTTVYVDSPPSSGITAPRNGAFVNATGITMTGTATDGAGTISNVMVSIVPTGAQDSFVNASTDKGSTTGHWTSWAYVWKPASGTNGSFTIKSQATDTTGNTETPGSGITVTVDSIPPISTITAPSNGSIVSLASGTYTVTGTASDTSGSGVARVEVSTDGGVTWNSAQNASATGSPVWSSWTYTWSLSAGQHTIKSRATDNAGNVEIPGNGVAVNVQ